MLMPRVENCPVFLATSEKSAKDDGKYPCKIREDGKATLDNQGHGVAESMYKFDRFALALALSHRRRNQIFSAPRLPERDWG